CDFKFDFQPVADKPADLSRIVKIASNGTTLLLCDSTGAENPGHSMSEKTIMDNLEKVFESAEGRIILATFSSLIGRLQQAIWLSEKFNRKVVVEGYTMKSNLAIAQQLGYIKVKKGTLIKIEDVSHYSPKEVTVLCTGAQGEDRATLMRIANKEHKYLRVQHGDTVIFSSSVVPGNELTVQNLKDNLARQGAKVFHYKMLDIHASGHACQEDLKLMINLTQPKFFIPIHGHFSMLRSNADLAKELGIADDHIAIPSNGQIVELTKDKITLTEKFVPTNYIMVDGLGVGDVGEVVLRDRQTLSQDGIFIVIAIISSKTGSLINDPEIISRGFVYMKESKELIKEAKEKIRQIIKRSTGGQRPFTFNEAYIKNNLRDDLGAFLFKKTERRPMILPIVTEV
ncbi:MAG: ribonuclease J, partial [Candidatus Parcubacteria bacterium]|nr:ribonuclease J [Candidatus Parcubacteria bacterium]